MIHVGCIRCATSTTDHNMNMRARTIFGCWIDPSMHFDLFLWCVNTMTSMLKTNSFFDLIGLIDLIDFQVPRLLAPLPWNTLPAKTNNGKREKEFWKKPHKLGKGPPTSTMGQQCNHLTFLSLLSFLRCCLHCFAFSAADWNGCSNGKTARKTAARRVLDELERCLPLRCALLPLPCWKRGTAIKKSRLMAWSRRTVPWKAHCEAAQERRRRKATPPHAPGQCMVIHVGTTHCGGTVIHEVYVATIHCVIWSIDPSMKRHARS